MTLESYVRQYVYPGVFSYVASSIWLWKEGAKNEVIVAIHHDVKDIIKFKIAKVKPGNPKKMGKDPLYVLLGKKPIQFLYGKTKNIWIEVAASFDKCQLAIWKDLNMTAS